MPFYEYECAHGSKYEHWFDMGHAVNEIHELENDFHFCDYKRVYSFQHVEDRRHMRRGISAATGEPVAQSRSEERLIEKTKGIEFVSRSEMPSQWKRLGDYARHVNAGGERVAADVVNPPESTSSQGEILRKMADRGVRFGA